MQIQEFGSQAPAQPFAQTISSRQGKLALHSAGKYHSTLALIEAMEEPQRTAALIEWNAAIWERTNSRVSAIGQLAGLSPAEIDALFTAAAQIT